MVKGPLLKPVLAKYCILNETNTAAANHVGSLSDMALKAVYMAIAAHIIDISYNH